MEELPYIYPKGIKVCAAAMVALAPSLTLTKALIKGHCEP